MSLSLIQIFIVNHKSWFKIFGKKKTSNECTRIYFMLVWKEIIFIDNVIYIYIFVSNYLDIDK